ncbi:Hypothetical predicted protein [Mytilus galloprovincialis]|uniref:SRCR domain-containing protein n=1 Tax=Mytilus galloprovincialis TaxID=29158 RepID=A0A8B6C2K4_MYTGA|nr:Hypothetical predicted protein [Mytilus galloprovincialis]
MFGHGEGVNTITNLRCNGSESSIRECVFEWVGKTTCTQGHYAGVICTSDIRLTNGKSPTEGRIEIKHNNVYSSICASNFDDVDASVVCSMLGFNNPYPDLCDSCFGTTPGLHLTNVNCTGDELDVETCPSSGWQSGNCSNGGDVGLICKTRVRLNGGDNPSEGRLEVYHHQKWGTVCSDGFEQLDGRVICTMLGYNTTNPHVSAIPITTDVPEVWMTQINCFGTEDDITACSFPGWSLGNCSTSNYVNIECGIGVRLVDGLKPYEGRVEVSHDGQWGTICNNGFTVNDARVICRMLGFETENVTVYANATFGNGSSNIMMDNLKCIGNETHIAACSFTGWGKHKCQHNQDVSISCGQTPLRLVNGTRHSVGRLEVYHNNKWGSVCNNNFDINDAKVVCRSLELNTKVPYVLPSAYFGRHDQDVSVLCDTMVKLVGGTDQSNGRVEIFNDGKWGTICDDGFNVPDAAVICNMLGFNNSNPKLMHASHFGYGSGEILLRYVECRGNEHDISDCNHPGWRNIGDCLHSEDVGVDCCKFEKVKYYSSQPNLVDCVNTLLNEGTIDSYVIYCAKAVENATVEVFHDGEWGTICNHGFDVNDAKVICNTLGYQESTPTVVPVSKYRSGFGPIWLENVMCTGNEVDIALCNSNGWGNVGQCSHTDDAALTCGENNKYKSRRNENDPTIIDSSDFGNHNISKYPYKIHCTGGEFDVALCNITLLRRCPNNDYVGVRCPRTQLQLITMSSPSTGRVEVKHEGRWGSICGNSFDDKAARVLCRMLGFESDGAQFYVNGTFGKSDELPWLDNLKCDGFEQDISMCQKNWTTKACNGIDNVGIACAPTPVRLVSGAGPWEGRVEVFMHGQWGTICDSSFNVEEASVICRMVGFKEAFTQPRMMLSSYFGQSNLPIRMSEVSCSGTELDINACILGTWGNNTCSRTHEVGVDCRETNVRLSGGSHDMEGRVEILRKGIWSAICDEDWDDVEATIVCKTLASFPFDRQVIGKSFKGSFFGAGRGLISYSRVKCNGSEIDLMHCSFKEIISPTCDHSNEAGVACACKFLC